MSTEQRHPTDPYPQSPSGPTPDCRKAIQDTRARLLSAELGEERFRLDDPCDYSMAQATSRAIRRNLKELEANDVSPM